MLKTKEARLQGSARVPPGFRRRRTEWPRHSTVARSAQSCVEVSANLHLSKTSEISLRQSRSSLAAHSPSVWFRIPAPDERAVSNRIESSHCQKEASGHDKLRLIAVTSTEFSHLSAGELNAALLTRLNTAANLKKTRGKGTPNRRVHPPGNGAHGAGDQNGSCSNGWAVRQEKIQPLELCFFLTSPFRELIRILALVWRKDAEQAGWRAGGR